MRRISVLASFPTNTVTVLMANKKTHFGYQEIDEDEKEGRVAEVVY
jgi:hypothetical protein